MSRSALQKFATQIHAASGNLAAARDLLPRPYASTSRSTSCTAAVAHTSVSHGCRIAERDAFLTTRAWLPLLGYPANLTCYDEGWRTSYRMKLSPAQKQTRVLVQAAAAVCEDKKGQDTRILELDPVDSGLSDFFLVTSATNDRQAVAIADEIELRLKREFGVYPNSVEGRRKGEWILLDYVDFVVHVFLAERRAFYDIERLRKSARPLTPAEFDAELKAALAEKTRAVREKAAAEEPRP